MARGEGSSDSIPGGIKFQASLENSRNQAESRPEDAEIPPGGGDLRRVGSPGGAMLNHALSADTLRGREPFRHSAKGILEGFPPQTILRTTPPWAAGTRVRKGRQELKILAQDILCGGAKHQEQRTNFKT